TEHRVIPKTTYCLPTPLGGVSLPTSTPHSLQSMRGSFRPFLGPFRSCFRPLAGALSVTHRQPPQLLSASGRLLPNPVEGQRPDRQVALLAHPGSHEHWPAQ